MNRPISLAVIAAFTLAAVGAGPASAADPTYPTGSFTIRTTTSYVDDRQGYRPEIAWVDLTRLSVSDDATPASDVVVKVYSGTDVANSTNGAVWTGDSATFPILYGGAFADDPTPLYHLAGTYHPYVTLTDGDGNTTTLSLPTVTLVDDTTAPVTTLRIPTPRKRHTFLAWRYLRGTSVDAGSSSPATGNKPVTGYSLLQRRHGFYYFYDAAKLRWHKGLRTQARTLARYGTENRAVTVGATGWRSRYVAGLTRGRLWVRVSSEDASSNSTPLRLVASCDLTRRR